jgi:Ran-binding protein 1
VFPQIIVNHLVNPDTALEPNVGSDRSWVWSAYDYSNGELEEAVFAIRFANSENAQKYKEAFESAKDEMRKLNLGEDAGDSAAGDEAAEALAAVSVKEEQS